MKATILLKASGAQTGKAMGLECALPGEELLFRQLIATAGFLESDLTGAHCSHHRGFATDHPSPGIRRRQLYHGRARINSRPQRIDGSNVSVKELG
jgi:hypothetical protein